MNGLIAPPPQEEDLSEVRGTYHTPVGQERVFSGGCMRVDAVVAALAGRLLSDILKLYEVQVCV